GRTKRCSGPGRQFAFLGLFVHSAGPATELGVRPQRSSAEGIVRRWVQRGQEDRPMLSELHGLTERWFQAWLEKGAATVERLMAADYFYVAPNGLVLEETATIYDDLLKKAKEFELSYPTRLRTIVGGFFGGSK